MKRLLIPLYLLALFACPAFAQDSLVTATSAKAKTNIILYFEMYFGAGVTERAAAAYASELNYQLGNNLFSIRNTTVGDLPISFMHGPDMPQREKNVYVELGLLYGRRFVKGGHAISYSAGLAYNYGEQSRRNTAGDMYTTSAKYPGIPYEFTIAWFKRNKRIPNALFTEPKPVAFGVSIGLKLNGTIAKNSYITAGVVIGLGNHKHY